VTLSAPECPIRACETNRLPGAGHRPGAAAPASDEQCRSAPAVAARRRRSAAWWASW